MYSDKAVFALQLVWGKKWSVTAADAEGRKWERSVNAGRRDRADVNMSIVLKW